MKLTFIEGRLFEGEHRADALHIQTDLPAGFSVRIAFLTPKGRRVETEDLTLTDGEGDYEVPQSLLDGAGVLLGQLIAVSDDRVLKSEIFPFDVERSLPDDVSDAPDGVFYTLKGVAMRLDALEGVIGDLVTDAEFHSYVDSALSNKQDTLVFDDTPTAGSTNPVTSGGIKSFVEGKGYLTEHRTLTVTGDLDVSTLKISNLSASFSTALDAESVELQLNYTPYGSSRTEQVTCVLVDRRRFTAAGVDTRFLLFSAVLRTSFTGLVKTYLLEVNWQPNTALGIRISANLRALQEELTFNNEPTAGSTNPVTSAGIKTYVDTGINDAISSVWDENPVCGLGVSNIVIAYAEEPASPQEGDAWYDTTGTDPLVRFYDGTDWDEVETPDDMTLYVLI